jgi:trehalose 6-phosphate phosphatase
MRFHPDKPARIADGVAPLPATLRTALDVALFDFDGAFVEDKGFSLAIHYRPTAATTGRLRAILEDLIADEPRSELEVMNGHNVLELKPRGADKGKAIAAFLDVPPFLGRTPIFVGDDETDESGFSIVADRGGIGLSVGVRRRGASGVFENPQAVRKWLAAFAVEGQRE